MPQLDLTTYFIQGVSVLVVLFIMCILVWFSRLTRLYSFIMVPNFIFIMFRGFIFSRTPCSYSLYMIAGSLAHLNRVANTSSFLTVRRPLTYFGW